MSKQSISIFIFLCLVLCLPGGGLIGRAQVPNLKPQPSVNPSGLHVDFGSLPLYFTANRGQVDGRALFYAKASRYTLWLTEDGLVFDSFKSEAKRPEAPAAGKESSLLPGKRESRKYERDVSRLVFLNASKHPEIVPADETALKVNYFIGNDPAKWHTAVPTSGAVVYKNIYDRIDLKVYGLESRIEYDWIVRPGGDPRDIRFKYENVKGTRVDEEGNLLIKTEFGELMHKKPAAYQMTESAPLPEGQSKDEIRTAVESTFRKIGENAYGFEVGAYEVGRELVIDPVVLAYSTYLGGNGEDYGQDIALDDDGYVYVTGRTSSSNFPTLSQYQTGQTNFDVILTKIDPTKSGTACLIYSTYLGGNGDDFGEAIAVDDSGNAYVSGYTNSRNYPTRNQYQTHQAWTDAFITKIDTTQSGDASLVYSTYLGGNDYTTSYGISADNSGNVYVTGNTYSTNFPIRNQYQTDQWGEDAYLTMLDTTKSGDASLVYSTYLGGNGGEIGTGTAVDADGYVYLSGYTNSTNFPTRNQYQADPGDGTLDVFVAKFDMTKSGDASLLYATYLGGNNNDSGFVEIAVDGRGKAYIAGVTWSTNFPTRNAYQTYPGDGMANAYFAELDTTKSGDASLVYSTYLGGSSDDLAYGIALDDRGNTYVSGFTRSSNFPTRNPYQTDQAGEDAFLAKIDTTKSGDASLIYSTYLGGSGDERGFRLAVDGAGNAYMTGVTWSTDFPTVNQYQTDQAGIDAFIAKIRASADIAVTKTSDNLTPKVDDEFNFTVTATNIGPMEASGLKVTDKLPTGLGYVSSTPSQGAYNSSTGVWDIGSLAKDAAATLTLKARADDPGEVTNTAAVSALNESDPDNSNDSASADVTVLTPCTIETSPSGLSITVDAASSIAPQTFHWTPGSSHSIGVTSPQTGTGTKYIYSSWSDAGEQTHTMTVPSSATTYTASFTTEYSLTTTANPLAGGTVTPTGTNYYAKDQNVQVQATSNAGYVFTGWSGDLGGYTNPTTVTMSGPKNVTANFVSGKTLLAPLLITPANNSTGQPTTLTLNWGDTNSSPQEMKYKVRVKMAGGAYQDFTLAANTTSIPKSGLTPGKLYYWNVQALGTGTTTLNSPWANGGIDFKFTVQPAVTLNVPTLMAPANGATGRPATLTLQWLDTNNSPQESSYKIRIKPAGGTYASYTVAADTVSFLKSGLASGHVYYWSVQAKGNGTSIKDSTFSADWKFTTAK